jgi:hypothetical protein
MYAPEFGGKASALINVATRAGSNAFRGTLFEFRRDDVFDSPNYFRPPGQPVPPLRQDQFGGTLGGPVVRNRSFFFASYERLRMERSLTRAFSVPSLAERAGNFAGHAPICDPLTVPAAGVCTPFPNNTIPAERIDPIATALLTHVPVPTSDGAQNLTAVEEQDRHLDQVSLRFDHQFSPSDNLLARFSTFDAEEIQPFGTAHCRKRSCRGSAFLTTKTRNVALSHTRVFGTGMLNESRFGWMTVEGGQVSPNRGNTFAQDVGLLGVTTILATRAFRRSRPAVSTAHSAIRRSSRRDNQHFELFDNFTIDRGAHRVKFGAYISTCSFDRNSRTTREALHLHRPVQRERVRRLSPGLSGVGRVRHWPRRRERPDNWLHLCAPGRLAGARQPVAQPGPRYDSPAHVRRRQPAVVDRPVDARRPIRHRQR